LTIAETQAHADELFVLGGWLEVPGDIFKIIITHIPSCLAIRFCCQRRQTSTSGVSTYDTNVRAKQVAATARRWSCRTLRRFMVKIEVATDDFIIFDTDPDDRHLWTPISVQRCYMSKWTGANEVSNRFWNCHSFALRGM